jgi:putative transposase
VVEVADKVVMTCPPRIDSQIMLDLRKKMRGYFYGKTRLSPEQIISKLREVEILLSIGHTVQAASRHIGFTERTYYRWRKEYGGMKIDQVKRLKEVEKENTRLKKLVADLSLDNAILKKVSRGNFQARQDDVGQCNILSASFMLRASCL